MTLGYLRNDVVLGLKGHRVNKCKQKTHTNRNYKPKSTGPTSPVRTAHMSVHSIDTVVVHNTAQNSSDNLPLILQKIII